MANVDIDDLTAAVAAAASNLFEIQEGAAGASRKLTLTQIAAFLDDLAETLTNKTIVGSNNTISDIAVSSLANGTDGELITWDASGVIATVAVGTSGQVLTSNGVGAAPTFQDAAGGGSNFTDRIPLVMMAPQGTVGFPDFQALATMTGKISGMVLPDGAAVSTINFKCNVPNDLASTPAASIKFYIIGLGTGTSDNVRLTVSTLAAADAESIDQALTAETEATVPIPDAAEVQEVYDQDMTTDPVAGDTLIVQLARDPTDASDDYAANIMVIAAFLEIDRTTTA